MDSPILAGRSGIGERWHTTEVGIYEKDPPVWKATETPESGGKGLRE